MFWLLIVIAEIYFFIQFAGEFGFLKTLGVYLIPTIMGAVLMRFRSRDFVYKMQTGQLAADSLLSRGAEFVVYFAMMIPSIGSRFFAVLMLVPAFRRKIAESLKSKFSGVFASGGAQGGAFRTGGFGFTYKAGGFNTGQGNPFEQFRRQERDVSGTSADPNVIDVQPIKVEHKQNSEN